MIEMKKSSYRSVLLVSLVIVLLYLAPLYLNNFVLFVLAILLINILWAVSTWAIFHQAGQALFAVAVIAAIGGYTTALLGQLIPNAWVTIPLALLVSMLVGIFFYVMATRVQGHIQFAVLNLAFIFIFSYLVVAFTTYTGGIDGIKVPYFYPPDLFQVISRKYMVVLTICLAALILIHKLMISRFGQVITLIGRNPLLAATTGINTERYIFIAYLIFAPMIGLGGILYSHFVGHIAPEAWNADLSLIIVFCTLIGGSSSIWGPIIGAVLAVGIPISFDITAEFRFAIVGIMAILIFIFKPAGIVGWARSYMNGNKK